MEERHTFKRKIYDKLLAWKRERDGRTAVLIEGARRIGKSTIVEEFARNEYESYILIDFSKTSEEVFNLFKDVSDLNYIFLRLQIIYNVQLRERKSLIIFDEVQRQPLARQAIKHLVADHRYDYIETGSLISIRKNVADIVIPSEETRLPMYPMDYEEFRWALGDTVAQMLTAMGDELYYHTFPTESGKHYYEVDFLLSRHNKLCPIEVKSSGYKSHASLDAFCEKFSDRIQNRYIVFTKDFKRENGITYLPAYMTMML